jgi:hypothetical protein
MLIRLEKMDRGGEEGRGGDGQQGVRPIPRPQQASTTAEEFERR